MTCVEVWWLPQFWSLPDSIMTITKFSMMMMTFDYLSDDLKEILEKVYDDGDDIFENYSDEKKDILEEVFNDGDHIFENIFDDAKDMLEKVFDD